MEKSNLLQGLPDAGQAEQFEPLLNAQGVLIERITSRGQCSAAQDWYQSPRAEWVMLVCGRARLMWEDGSLLEMAAGDHVTIPANARHRVDWTDPDQDSVWLAVHLPQRGVVGASPAGDGAA
ncbi:MAG: cupin domain-containing protein [Pseudomonadales bacterium]|nr:cupin domain-containing protein [Pseudomonadales bacterium]MCP5331005.1 cupin domain-containing protein [Pseudomonadales bacterium]MCP5344635.1 cupin domain-containing protein [Pseudomonadales bacterium]